MTWWENQKVNVAVVGLFMLLTIVVSWPIPLHLDEVIVGEDNDTGINPWADWWSAKAWSDPDLSLWETEYIFYPHGADLHYHSFSHLNTLVSLALKPLIGALPAYNLTMLGNFVLIGLSMFQLAHYLTGSKRAALLAAIVFTFNSQTQYQIAHPVLFSTWTIAWMTLFLMRGLNEKQPRDILRAALFVILGTSTSTLLLLLMILWVGFLLLYCTLTKQLSRQSWSLIALFAILSGIGTSIFLYPQLQNAFLASNDNFVIAPQESITTDLFSLFVPHWYAWFIRGLYLGILPLFLAMLAFGHKRQQAKLWFWLVLISYLFAIGPTPRLFIWEFDQIVLPWTLPIAPVLRNMYRMMLLFALGWAMVVAYGWQALLEQVTLSEWKQRGLFLVVAMLVLVDYAAVPFPAVSARLSPFYTEYLEDVPNDVALAILPTGRQDDKRYMFHQTFHQHPITGGVISRPDEEVFQLIENNAILRAGAVDLDPVPIPSELAEPLAELAAHGVGYVIFEKKLLSDETLDTWRMAFQQAPVFEDDFVLVYEVIP